MCRRLLGRRRDGVVLNLKNVAPRTARTVKEYQLAHGGTLSEALDAIVEEWLATQEQRPASLHDVRDGIAR